MQDEKTIVRWGVGMVGAALAGVWLGCGGGPDPAGKPDPHEPAPRIQELLQVSDAPVLAVPNGDTVHLSAEVLAFYAERGHRPAWTRAEGFLPAGEQVAGALARADGEGLDPERYHADAVRALIEHAHALDAQELPVGDVLGALDLVLTEGLLRYATDLARGTVDPEAAGVPWLIPRGDSATAERLAELASASDVSAALDSLRPAPPQYAHLLEALERYERIVASGGWPAVSEGGKLAEGDAGPRVVELRRRLVAEGDSTEAALVAGAPDPARFDARLAEAVDHFQARHGIDADGAVGAATLEALNVPAADRLLALRLNLDRWRWLPQHLGERYVLVNVAGFEMAVMEGDRPALRMNVVVGKEGRNTPFFQDTLEHVVVNPYWNVPPTILRKDIVPAVRRDPGYLARNGYEVVSRSGARTSATAADLASGRYGVRQRPGANNSLGSVKFLFPNDMDIYLHDTPARHLFERTQRAFSSGCIRVEKPRELAEYLFRTATSQPAGTWERLRASGRESWVKLDEKLPIYIVYFTAWAEDGTVRFYPDVYERDLAVEAVARAALGPLPEGAAGASGPLAMDAEVDAR